MKLLNIVTNLSTFPAEATIYAESPWKPESKAIVAAEPETGELPLEARKNGLQYFLEISIAKDFIEGWLGHQKEVPSIEQQCQRLIHYATYDA